MTAPLHTHADAEDAARDLATISREVLAIMSNPGGITKDDNIRLDDLRDGEVVGRDRYDAICDELGMTKADRTTLLACVGTTSAPAPEPAVVVTVAADAPITPQEARKAHDAAQADVISNLESMVSFSGSILDALADVCASPRPLLVVRVGETWSALCASKGRGSRKAKLPAALAPLWHGFISVANSPFEVLCDDHASDRWKDADEMNADPFGEWAALDAVGVPCTECVGELAPERVAANVASIRADTKRIAELQAELAVVTVRRSRAARATGFSDRQLAASVGVQKWTAGGILGKPYSKAGQRASRRAAQASQAA